MDSKAIKKTRNEIIMIMYNTGHSAKAISELFKQPLTERAVFKIINKMKGETCEDSQTSN